MAIATRFERLHWGLEHNLWFADETVWALRLRSFDELTWRSFDTTQLGYPTLYPNVGGLAMRAVGGGLHGADAIAWMRALGAVASVLAVLATARLGFVAYGAWTGVT